MIAKCYRSRQSAHTTPSPMDEEVSGSIFYGAHELLQEIKNTDVGELYYQCGHQVPHAIQIYQSELSAL